ncbi:MAG: isoprenylcysteine carboxylmethyltransferase family protein [Verrucomicrobia bacterium]|jgi:protein-S-isoprenylcysteine O-methyltransferase Ste14|nr:isoprenylcysteine carboxylmethyltransferase family protein [Verrucomicrobiota bacterium]MDA7510834.1 protein-S-isoprenylcysteine O-methyltransferase [Verrucomicrobiota bacterium]
MNLLVGTNALFLVALVVYVAIRNHFMTRLKFAETEVNAIDTSDRILVFFIALTVILLPVVYLLSPFFGFADYSVPLAIRSLGIVVLAISLWVFWRSHVDLGTNWSPSLEVRKGHRLVTSGIYRRVRHPMYSSIWLWALGQAMTIPNGLIAWGPMICFSVMYFRRLPKEERMMRDRFGSEYEAYMKETGRLFPRLSK